MKSGAGGILWGEEILRAGQILRITTEGNSMFPAIRGRDTIVVAPSTGEELDIGEILIFRKGRELVAHRLIAKSTDNGIKRFVTKGDYHFSPDAPILRSQVLGKVIRIERGKRVWQLDSLSHRRRNRILAGLSSRSLLYFITRPLEKMHYFGRSLNDAWWWLRDRWERPSPAAGGEAAVAEAPKQDNAAALRDRD